MKLSLIIIILLIFASRNDKVKNNTISISEKVEVDTESMGCVLSQLQKTIDYKKRLSSLLTLNRNVSITLDSISFNEIRYLSKLKITENEVHLWLLRSNFEEVIPDTLLLHYEDNVEYFSKTESSFDLKNCTIVIQHEYNTEEESGCKEVEVIEFLSPKD